MSIKVHIKLEVVQIKSCSLTCLVLTKIDDDCIDGSEFLVELGQINTSLAPRQQKN